ncbi:AI-2E family transporter [Tepidimonas charontis]|uniref:AI-2 transport protein TqsA n=1 Tax=Tepidimonas charontis TaxID=2267262 RepID=A0A554XJL6_9BURK|nr:AI-2E family transporter [Tepidimonas charontis]TSE36026.1 AI-2 transport protein TqsA [Tepidimonas charontis]
MTLTDSQRHALLWTVLAVVGWWVMAQLAPVLLPFVLALVLAYALQPAVAWLAAHRVPRWLAAALALAALLSLMLAVVLVIVPVVTRQWPLLREQIPALLERLNAWMQPLAQRHGLELAVDVEAVRGLLRRLISGHEEELLGRVLASLRIGGSALLAVLGNLVLMPVVAYYLLLDWEQVVARARQYVPPRWRARVEAFFAEADAVLGQYLRGQLLVMGVLAVYYTAALALAGLELAVPIGVLTGLAIFVPYLGFGLGMTLALLAALLQFQTLWGVLLVAGIYAMGQVIESFYLTPRLVGERIGLHPIAVIFALMAFGHLLGFVGVLIALPASAVLLVALRRLQRLVVDSALFRPGDESRGGGE